MPLAPSRPSNPLVNKKPEPTPVSTGAGLANAPRDNLSTVDSSWVPKTHLLTALEGSAWKVDYYAQVLGMDQDPSGAQVSATGLSQSWVRIEGLELMVSSALSTSQDDATKAMIVTGTARMYPCVIPNEGDHFVADLGTGKSATLRITSTTKLSLYRQAVYEVNYQVHSDDADMVATLRRGTTRTFHYRRDFLMHGQNPLLTTSETQALDRLEVCRHRLITRVIERFFSREHQVFLVPDDEVVFDPFVAESLGRHIDPVRYPQVGRMWRQSRGTHEQMGRRSVFKVMDDADISSLPEAFTRYALTSPYALMGAPWLGGLGWAGYEYVVVATDGQVGIDALTGSSKALATTEWALCDPMEPEAPQSLTQAPVVSGPGVGEDDVTSDWIDLYAPVVTTADPRYRFIKGRLEAGQYGYTEGFVHPAHHGGTYIFSNAFYTGVGKLSTLECLVRGALEGKRPEATLVSDLCDLWSKWRRLDQFYYAPVLLFLIHCSMRMK